MNDDIERPTLVRAVERLRRDAGPADAELLDLVVLAYDEHEPAPADRTPEPKCPSCGTPAPCPVWTYASAEVVPWLAAGANARADALLARIDTYEARSEAAS